MRRKMIMKSAIIVEKKITLLKIAQSLQKTSNNLSNLHASI